MVAWLAARARGSMVEKGGALTETATTGRASEGLLLMNLLMACE